MGEARKAALQVSFDAQIKLEFHSAKITRDIGLLAYRELDERLGLTVLPASRGWRHNLHRPNPSRAVQESPLTLIPEPGKQ